MVESQGPALLRRDIEKGEDRLRRAFEGAEGAQSVDISERVIVAGKNEVVAIVDPAPEFRVEIRTAAPASVRGGFVQAHGATGGGKFDRCGQAREARPDDVDAARARHFSQNRPWRSTSQTLRGFDRLMRASRSLHLVCRKAASVAR